VSARVRLGIAAAALACALAACGDGEDLSGSIDQVYSLDYQTVRARLYSSELAIEYVDARGAVPVRVTLRRAAEEPSAGGDYDLQASGDLTGRHADGSELPRFDTGALHLDDYDASGDAFVSGSFEANFRSERDTLSIAGRFAAELEIVED